MRFDRFQQIIGCRTSCDCSSVARDPILRGAISTSNQRLNTSFVESNPSAATLFSISASTSGLRASVLERIQSDL